MSYSFQNPSAEVIESYLKSAKTIAIVGLSHRKEAASYQVAHFLQAAGYRIIPVNPSKSQTRRSGASRRACLCLS